jgi:general secretion pathway protein E
MRLLEASAPISTFTELGFPPDVAERLRQLIALPQGMLLVTGPTGSGKSTTLYSGRAGKDSVGHHYDRGSRSCSADGGGVHGRL